MCHDAIDAAQARMVAGEERRELIVYKQLHHQNTINNQILFFTNCSAQNQILRSKPGCIWSVCAAMLIPFTISLLGGLSLTAASPVSHLKAIERSQEGIHWGACNKTEFTSEVVAKVPTSVQCATLEVPLEYSDKDGDKLALSLVKIAAAEKAEDGQTKSILFNFGGPGSEARLSLASFSKLLVA